MCVHVSAEFSLVLFIETFYFKDFGWNSLCSCGCLTQSQDMWGFRMYFVCICKLRLKWKTFWCQERIHEITTRGRKEEGRKWITFWCWERENMRLLVSLHDVHCSGTLFALMWTPISSFLVFQKEYILLGSSRNKMGFHLNWWWKAVDCYKNCKPLFTHKLFEKAVGVLRT